MTFAHWKKITVPTGRLLDPLRSSEHVQHLGNDEIVEHFILDIPGGTTKNDVVAKLAGHLLGSPARIEETDGLAFQEDWPSGVLRQFEENKKRDKRLLWPSLA